MHPRISESVGHGKPRVQRGEFGWLVVTHHNGEMHVWAWRPLHKWREAVMFANELAIQMFEWEWANEH